jgi:recombinational DNA repair protein (RecF pathway)
LDQGKFSLISKNSKKRGGSLPEILDLGLFEYKVSNKPNSIPYLKAFKPQKNFMGLRQRLTSFVCACAWIEAIDLLTIEHHLESGDLFHQTLNTLAELDSLKSDKEYFRSLCLGLHKALNIAGYGRETPEAASFRGLQLLVSQIENISHRKTKSFESVYQIVKTLATSTNVELDTQNKI